jgi:hypothetical protein
MKASEIINSIDQVISIDGSIHVRIVENKNRLNKKPTYLIFIGTIHFVKTREKFTSAQKALNRFFDLCLEMNLSTYNNSLK